jgi:hypothetical protein
VDVKYLDYFNGMHMRRKSLPELVSLALPHIDAMLVANKIDCNSFSQEYKHRVVEAVVERVTLAKDFADASSYFFMQPDLNRCVDVVM